MATISFTVLLENNEEKSNTFTAKEHFDTHIMVRFYFESYTDKSYHPFYHQKQAAAVSSIFDVFPKIVLNGFCQG